MISFKDITCSYKQLLVFSTITKKRIRKWGEEKENKSSEGEKGQKWKLLIKDCLNSR